MKIMANMKHYSGPLSEPGQFSKSNGNGIPPAIRLRCFCGVNGVRGRAAQQCRYAGVHCHERWLRKVGGAPPGGLEPFNACLEVGVS